MKKVLLTLVIGLVVAAGASYFGLQWRAEKALNEAFDQLSPIVDASFESLTIALDGRMVVSQINIFVPATASNIRVRQAEFGTSGLLETLQFQQKIEQGQLPENLTMALRGLSVSVPRTTFASWSDMYQPTLVDRLSALGCGNKTAITPLDYYGMGLSELLLDIQVGYQYTRPLDELVASVVVSVDGVGTLSVSQTMLGMVAIIDNWQNAMMLGDSALSTQKIDVSIEDNGYNNRYADYCSSLAKMSREEWRELNADMVDAAIQQIALQGEFEFSELYRDLITPDVRVDIGLLPTPGFDVTELDLDIVSLVEMAGMTAYVNNQELSLRNLTYDSAALSNINLAAVRAAYLDTPEEAVSAASSTSNSQSIPAARRLIDIPTVTLPEYVGREVQLTRNDGQVFNGELLDANRERAIVRMRLGSGFSDLPVLNSTIRAAKLYPEN